MPHGYTLTIASGDLPLGEISGRVTDIRGSGIANVWVTLYEPSGRLEPGARLRPYRTATAITASPTRPATTRCTVRLQPALNNTDVVGSYINEWYNDAATLERGADADHPGRPDIDRDRRRSGRCRHDQRPW